MSRLLVTGGAGFIGANFVHHRLGRGSQDRIVVLDALTYAGDRQSLAALEADPAYRFVHADILDQELVEGLMRDENIDTVVHFAAESHVDRSIVGPDAFVQTNVVGTHALLKAARSVWLEGSGVPHRFHHVSTDEVYGTLGPDDPAFAETTPYAPNSPYAASKAGSDHLVRAYHHTYGLDMTITNCSNNYGPYQFPEKLIPLVIIRILQNESIPVYGDGKNVRDWLYVEDHCLAIDAVLEGGTPGETYCVGGDNELHNIDLVESICSLIDAEFAADSGLAERFPGAAPSQGNEAASLITFVTDRPGHDRRYAINATKIADELDFRPRSDFDALLRSTIRWYLDNEDWWRAILDGSYANWIEQQYQA